MSRVFPFGVITSEGSLLAPSPLRGEGWDEGRVLRHPSWGLAFGVGVVARLLTCDRRESPWDGGLSDAWRRPSPFSLRAHATARSGGERRSRPEGRRAEPVPDSIRERPESREGTKRNGLSSPPTLQAMTLKAFWNRSGSSCYTHGHTAPSPSTEARVGLSQVVALSSPQRDRTVPLFPLRSFSLTVIPAKAGIQSDTRAKHTPSTGVLA
jgi:hypothetical protein